MKTDPLLHPGRAACRLAGLLLLAGLCACGGQEPAATATTATATAEDRPRNQVEAAQQEVDAALRQSQERLDQAMKELDEDK